MELDTPMNQTESAWIQTMNAQLLSQGAEAVRPMSKFETIINPSNAAYI